MHVGGVHAVLGRDSHLDSFHLALGSELKNAYLKLKTDDWNAYSAHLTQWERDTTLNC